jgi:DNA-binding MarR family transcriptional regulator
MPRTPSEEDIALAESLFGLLPLVGRLAHTAADGCDLGSPERARLLYGLKAGPVRAGRLAQRAKLSPSSITELVEGMEQEGMVRREPDPEDRRAVRVNLTPEGRRQLQRFEQTAAVALADALASLTAAQRQRVRAAFNDLRHVIVNDSFTSPSHTDINLRPTRGHKEAASVR